MNAIKSGQEERDDASHSEFPTLVTDECHMEKVKCVLERMCSISYMAIGTKVRIPPAGIYRILINDLGK
jgi:hypothetical protein